MVTFDRISSRRMFSGRRYAFYRSFPTKGEAERQAKVLRRDGAARITAYQSQMGKRYAVWYRN